MLYSIKLYVGMTTSISWASSTCVLFVLLIHLVNGAKFLSITFLLVLFGAAAFACVKVHSTLTLKF